MTLEEIKLVLDAALSLRSPVLDPNARPRDRVAALEDYMLKAAQVCGVLYEARHWLRALEVRLSDEWRAMDGWQYALRRPAARATKAEVDAAKAQASPVLFEAGRTARLLRESVVDQITRLDKEGDRMSRAYAMESGS